MKLFSLKGFIAICVIVLFFYWPVFFRGNYPIPADTIVGLYHPWRDIVWDGFTNGVPFKNFLITDPVRQQYPWRELSMDILKKGELPVWNPYTFSGSPLLANIQSASLYPLNTLLLIAPFHIGWTVMIVLQPLLAAVFIFCYLKVIKVSSVGALLGAVVFAFCGFSIAWLEWGTLVHTLLWLPLILCAVEKIAQRLKEVSSLDKKVWLWIAVIPVAMIFSLLAGHLQIFFYSLVTIALYVLSLPLPGRKKIILATIVLVGITLALFVTSIQWIPAIEFINQSNRSLDQFRWQKPDWFLPWQNLVQFIAPDFFGNPSTLNYWGVWNYGEFVAYIGIIPLFFALYEFFNLDFRKHRAIWLIFVFSIAMALPTPLAEVPYRFSLPFIATGQPSRWIGIVDFSLAILAAIGLEHYLKDLNKLHKNGKVIMTVITLGSILISLWFVTLYGLGSHSLQATEHFLVAKNNLVVPSFFFSFTAILLLSGSLLMRKFSFGKNVIAITLLVFTVLDLYRFGWKFTPFSNPAWLYPQTSIIQYLQSVPQPVRFMTTDSKIFPPNFSTHYRLQYVGGYDPLYLTRYGEYVAMWIRDTPDNSTAAFNRILEPQNFNSPLSKLANVGYVMSLKDESAENLQLVMQEGQTRLYAVRDSLPRAYFVSNILVALSKEEAARDLFDHAVISGNSAVIEEAVNGLYPGAISASDSIQFMKYSENEIRIKTTTDGNRYMVLSDVYYPIWKVYVDGVKSKIYRTNYIFRGLVVPKGTHEILFLNQ